MSDINPWESIQPNSKRRITPESRLYWFVSSAGSYGLSIIEPSVYETNDSNSVNLHGIKFNKQVSETEGLELSLLLENNSDWEIFYALCNDLINTYIDSETKEFHKVEGRLLRWQKILQKKRSRKLSIEQQMGIFSELEFMETVILPRYGLSSINYWTGADYDKQDFLLDSCSIEVKSYKTSKGSFIRVSSLEQLLVNEKPLYLVAYALTPKSGAKTISMLVDSISGQLESAKEYDKLNEFENKLIDLGYIPQLLDDEFQGFIIDQYNTYRVDDEFPKVHSSSVDPRISKVSYNIDLARCSENLCTIDEMFK